MKYTGSAPSMFAFLMCLNCQWPQPHCIPPAWYTEEGVRKGSQIHLEGGSGVVVTAAPNLLLDVNVTVHIMDWLAMGPGLYGALYTGSRILYFEFPSQKRSWRSAKSSRKEKSGKKYKQERDNQEQRRNTKKKAKGSSLQLNQHQISFYRPKALFIVNCS